MLAVAARRDVRVTASESHWPWRIGAAWLAGALGLLIDHREVDLPSAPCDTDKLQRLAGLQRNLRDDIERLAADRNPHLVIAEELQHLGADHRARLQDDTAVAAAACAAHWAATDGVVGLMTIDMDWLHRIMPAEAIALS